MTVTVDGHELSLSNLDKVLYPATGFTKGEVIDYYTRIAPVMLGHLESRPVTFVRFPDGVEAHRFFEKRCPDHAPDFVPRAPGPGSRDGRPIRYCLIDSRAALVWAANMAALELHTTMARVEDLTSPTMMVFDLDPGPPAGFAECARVARMIGALLSDLGLVAYPKSSGSKGIHLYVPLNEPHTYEQTSGFAHAVAVLLERRHPDLVSSNMRKAERVGKVLVDWSQNSFHKTTVTPYSLRGRSRPTVAAPVTWEEVDAAVTDPGALLFEAPEVLERVERHGDLFADVLTRRQRLPEWGGG